MAALGDSLGRTSSLAVRFVPDLPEAGDDAGVVNLHRLKRFVPPGNEDGAGRAVRALGERLKALRQRGFPIVWTLHNMYPIDGEPVRAADRDAVDLVLSVADAVLCHTEADATAIGPMQGFEAAPSSLGRRDFCRSREPTRIPIRLSTASHARNGSRALPFPDGRSHYSLSGSGQTGESFPGSDASRAVIHRW